MYRNTTHGGYSSVLQTSRELFVLSAQNEVRRPQLPPVERFLSHGRIMRLMSQSADWLIGQALRWLRRPCLSLASTSPSNLLLHMEDSHGTLISHLCFPLYATPVFILPSTSNTYYPMVQSMTEHGDPAAN